MNKKKRYLLIAIGFVFFLLASPLIVLYVRGISYDFKAGKFYKTGIIAIRTEPKDAAVYADDRLKLESSGDIKFLRPKDYKITVKKAGFFEWSKVLPVRPGQVSWASPVPNKIFLFLSEPVKTEISREVLDFFSTSQLLAYLSAGSLHIAPINEPEKKESYQLPRPAEQLAVSDNGQLILAYSNPAAASNTPALLVFDAVKKELADFSEEFTGPIEAKISPAGEIYILNVDTLFKADLQQKKILPVLEKVKAFAFNGDSLYYITSGPAGPALMVRQPAAAEGMVLLENLPQFQNGSIVVDFQKHVFLFLDGTFFRVASSLEKIAGNVASWHHDQTDSIITLVHSGELSYFDPQKGSLNYITRSSLPQNNLRVDLASGHAFVTRDRQLIGIELDTRDRQNEYVIYKTPQPQKFQVEKSAKNAIVLEGGNLYKLKIR